MGLVLIKKIRKMRWIKLHLPSSISNSGKVSLWLENFTMPSGSDNEDLKVFFLKFKATSGSDSYAQPFS